MRRLLRILLCAVTMLSLLICVASVVLWRRSERFYEWGEARRIGSVREGVSIVQRSVEWCSLDGVLQVRVNRRQSADTAWDRRELAKWLASSAPRYRTNILLYGRQLKLKIDRACAQYEQPTFLPWVRRGTLGPAPPPTDWCVIELEYRWLVALTGVLPCVAGLFILKRVIRKFRRRAPGLCLACGYDVRATPERCPEGGTVPKAVRLPGPRG